MTKHLPIGQPEAQTLILDRRSVKDGCWVWAQKPDRHGYGRIQIKGVVFFAHRAAYEAFVGPIPDGLQLDHLCRVRNCVNPLHLEPVDSKTNTLRSEIAVPAVNARKTHCKAGHPLSGGNVYYWLNRYGNRNRSCKACLAAAAARRKRRLL